MGSIYERFTSAPRLHAKIDGRIKRSSVAQWREVLSDIQSGKCFYCDQHPMVSPEVDHVLRWSFVLEDRTWNLVLACRGCNNAKRDKLPDIGALERLCARNEQIPDCHGVSFLRDFAEWRSRDLPSHIRGLYDQAVADNFPAWG